MDALQKWWQGPAGAFVRENIKKYAVGSRPYRRQRRARIVTQRSPGDTGMMRHDARRHHKHDVARVVAGCPIGRMGGDGALNTPPICWAFRGLFAVSQARSRMAAPRAASLARERFAMSLSLPSALTDRYILG